MQQLKLVKKPIEKKVEVQTAVKQAANTITDNNSMWNKVHAWLEKCKQEKENSAYFIVEYRADVHLDGSKDEHLTTSTTMERLFKSEDDSYGGCWGTNGTYNKNNLDELKKELIGWRKDFLEVPYCREKADGTALRDIKAENIRIFIYDKAKDFIARTAAWTINELALELKAIKEKPLTEEYLKKFDRMKFLNKEIEKLEYDILPGLKEKTEKAFDDRIETQTILDGEKFDLNAAYDLFKKLKLKLAKMEKEYDELRHEMYRWG